MWWGNTATYTTPFFRDEVKSIGPGGIDFRIALGRQQGIHSIDSNKFFPEEGDMFIFPSHLEHWVYPFKSKVTRISISGNLGKKNNA